MAWITRVRGLAAGQVREMRIDSPGEHESVIIDDPPTVNRIAEALRRTSPYSLNHEGIRQERRLTIHAVDGSAIPLRIGKGNSAHPDTVWIQEGVAVYQNPELYRVFEEVIPQLWDQKP